MSKLISGKEALIALASGEEVEYQAMDKKFYPLKDFLDSAKLRLKPKTITINGIEVPKPNYIETNLHGYENYWAIWTGEEYYLFESKQDHEKVIEALRSVFKPQ